jgi:hypothetical protein
VVSADLSAEAEVACPTGKYWRLIGGILNYTASADVATRTPIITIEQTDDTALDTLTLTTKVADDVEYDHFLFGTSGNIGGNVDVAAQGTLTVAVNPTATDTMTINGVAFTFVATLTGAANEILVGTNLAATKVSIENAIGVTPSGASADHSVTTAVRTSLGCTGADFATNDMVLTAVDPGTAGNSIATTETFASGSNVFDAATLGTTTAGVNATDVLGTENYPTNGVLLVPTDKVVLNVTNGNANDAAELAVFAIEFDNDPR